MPDLGPVPASALAALDFAGEDGYAAVTSPAFTPPLDFFLYPVEDLRADDGFVVIFHIVLRHFPFIRFRFFGQEVDGEPLLQQGIALVFSFVRMLSTVPGYQRFFLAGVSSPLEVSSLAMEWKVYPSRNKR